MSSAAATSFEDPHSSFQSLDHRTPHAAATAAPLRSLFRQASTRSVEKWNQLSRNTQILLVALSMTFSSFALSLIVAALSR